MAPLDHTLLHCARQFANGANVHLLNTLLFLYEHSSAESPDRVRYELKLRKLVALFRARLARSTPGRA